MIRAFIAAGFAVLASIAPADTAMAADLPVKAPQALSSWTGFHAGLSFGARWANNDWQTSDVAPGFGPVFVPTAGTGGTMNSVAARIGGYLGYNWQVAASWVVGIEGDVGWADNRSRANPLPGTAGLFFGAPLVGLPSGSVGETWDGSLRGRLGHLLTPATLVYGTGGVAWQRLDLNAACDLVPGNAFCFGGAKTEAVAATRVGWTVGGGVEQTLARNWIARIEYRYADFGRLSHVFFPNAFGVGFDDRFTARVGTQTHTATVGLAYRF